jgi:hypothetical protein
MNLIDLLTGSDPDVILCRFTTSLVASVHNATWLNKQNLRFMFRIRLVFDAFRNNVHFTLGKIHKPIPEINSNIALKHDERLVCISVIVPNKFPLDFDNPFDMGAGTEAHILARPLDEMVRHRFAATRNTVLARTGFLSINLGFDPIVKLCASRKVE